MKNLRLHPRIVFLWVSGFITLVLFLSLPLASSRAAVTSVPFRGWLALNGSSSFSSARVGQDLYLTGMSATLEAWIKRDPQASTQTIIIGKADVVRLSIVQECLHFEIQWASYGFGETLSYCGVIDTNWHHTAGVFEAATHQMRLYVDGELKAQLSRDYLQIDDVNAWQDLAVGSPGLVALDEARLSNAARYTGSTFQPTTTSFTCDVYTRALWHFDETAGTSVFHDACGREDDTLQGYSGAHTEGNYPLYLPVHFH